MTTDSSQNQGYANSDILKKPATMSHTISLPPSTSIPQIDRTDDSPHTPFPKAYRRVKEFLKKMLRAEVDLLQHDRNRAHPLLQEIGAAKAVEELRIQLMAFACQQWPFTAALNDQTTLAWWELLEPSPHARVLAVRSIS